MRNDRKSGGLPGHGRFEWTRVLAVGGPAPADARVITAISLLAGEGSNLQPPDPKSGVLPVELPAKAAGALSPRGYCAAAKAPQGDYGSISCS
jgi:hypothetical protein